ncbi:NUDIX domain-containing protein [Acidipropionibacterium timonense]|uniref:NUDIX domain-containing protein n=1 Tax=Acidipropionibacterium timonense TaxID=2161818 RepID=UPI0010309828
MPHLHTQPHGHDLTISAWILRRMDGRVKALVHRHRRMGIWIQPGGHVEHTENPWQALAHELREETGYELSQLRVLQPLPLVPDCIHDVMHPVPVALDTHSPYAGHFHSDIVMALVTDEDPAGSPAPGESTQFAWVDPDEYAAIPGAEHDAVQIMTMIVTHVVGVWHEVPATDFLLTDPPEPLTDPSEPATGGRAR